MTITNKLTSDNPVLFLHEMPSNTADKKTVFAWLNTRVYDPEITLNDKEYFEIRNRSVVSPNDSNKTTLLADALKEIHTWLGKQCCFSTDTQQVQSNHFHLLSLLEINLLHIKESVTAIENNRNLVKKAMDYLSEQIGFQKATPLLLDTVQQLLDQVKELKLVRDLSLASKQVAELKLVRDRSLASEIVLPKQAAAEIQEEISSMSLEELQAIQQRAAALKADETLALSKKAFSSAKRATSPINSFDPEAFRLQQQLNRLIFPKTELASFSKEELQSIQQRAAELKAKELEGYMDQL